MSRYGFFRPIISIFTIPSHVTGAVQIEEVWFAEKGHDDHKADVHIKVRRRERQEGCVQQCIAQEDTKRELFVNKDYSSMKESYES